MSLQGTMKPLDMLQHQDSTSRCQDSLQCLFPFLLHPILELCIMIGLFFYRFLILKQYSCYCILLPYSITTGGFIMLVVEGFTLLANSIGILKVNSLIVGLSLKLLRRTWAM